MTARRIQDDANVHRLRLLQQEIQMALPDQPQRVAVTQPYTVVSIDLARADQSGECESAPKPDSVRSDALRRELARMRLDEVADLAARNESPAHGYAARVEMDRRVAQAQIAAATAQRDAANILEVTLRTACLLIPAGLLSVVIGWLLFKLLHFG